MTESAVDLRKQVAREELHPGLILLASVNRDQSLRLLADALVHQLTSFGEPSDAIVNHVLEVSGTGAFILLPLP